MNSAAARRMDDTDPRRTDAEAVARTLSGDLTAYDRLIEKYQRRAVAVSYRLLGNVADAQDVCQEAFLRAFRSLETLKEPERFGAWLMRIVSNLSLNFRRGRRPTLALATSDEDAGPHDSRIAAKSEYSGGAERMAGQETQAAVTAAVEALPPQQRLALVLFAMEGLSQKEVAEIMECSVEMVKWNVFQARKTLKDQLAEYLEE
ncbi:MAG TPA: sigma-70 family RNA polymerase sigma factor [Phycisphaerae bacterium]|nr:sigma-70 family RNA polymerase sigma factor [Phycisphaerae bacterium]